MGGGGAARGGWEVAPLGMRVAAAEGGRDTRHERCRGRRHCMHATGAAGAAPPQPAWEQV